MAPFLRENQLVQTKNKKIKNRAHDLENQDASRVIFWGRNFF
jgi:hypothetical protein